MLNQISSVNIPRISTDIRIGPYGVRKVERPIEIDSQLARVDVLIDPEEERTVEREIFVSALIKMVGVSSEAVQTPDLDAEDMQPELISDGIQQVQRVRVHLPLEAAWRLRRLQRTRSLWPVFDRASEEERTNLDKTREALSELDNTLHLYTGPSDLWHNIAMTASRARMRELEMEIYHHGLEEWPRDVDLLSDLLQEYFGAHFDSEKAKEVWETLSRLPREQTTQNWRYWVFGALYQAVTLGNKDEGLRLLDEGLNYVKRDGLMNILQNYRRVLIDAPPPYRKEVSFSEKKLKAEYNRSCRVLESRYKLGLEMGVENGYMLAVHLARLYMEQSFGDSENPDRTMLDKALDMLEAAERMFTDNTNHPLDEIYRWKVNVLMAQRKYGQALLLLKSLRNSIPRMTMTQRLQLQIAAAATGQAADEQLSREQKIQSFLELLDQDVLFQLAKQNPGIRELVVFTAQRLVGED